MFNKSVFIFIFSIAFLFVSCKPETDNDKKSKGELSHLKVEYKEDPVGVDEQSPRLSWELSSNERGVAQTDYQILVASSKEKLKENDGDVWGSGKVSSDQTINVEYGGEDLESGEDYYWKVKVWTNKEEEVESDISRWDTGLLSSDDWEAEWTGLDSTFTWEDPDAKKTRLSARYFRKEFNADKDIKRATIHISGLGLYKLFINGQRIGDAELAPTPTEYEERVPYNTYDVTKEIEKGDNAIGTILGNGRFFKMRSRGDDMPKTANFGFPKMLLQLEITYKDGSKRKVISDSSWKVTADGPIIANNEYDGEVYDANKEFSGWSKPDFDDSQWLDAQAVSGPEGGVESQTNPNIEVMDTVRPQSINKIGSNKYIVDMGQNMVGWTELKITDGKKGDTVNMRFAEAMQDDTLYTDNLRGAEATDQYIMKDGKQKWEPSFTYHGFRYIEVSGYPGEPKSTDFVGKVVYDDLPTIGHFETSNKLVNQIYDNAYWGIRGNYRGMPTDCPQRDERHGWLGDRTMGAYGESFIFDNSRLYDKWLDDIEDGQKENGSIADIAPLYWEDMYSDNMTWPGAFVSIASMLNEQFGDKKPIKEHYPAMKKWLNYMKEEYMENYIVDQDTYGDWCMPPKDPEVIHSELSERQTDGGVLGTGYYYYMLDVMENMADILDKSDDKEEFSDLKSHVKEAFNDKYLNEDNSYSNNTVTANVIPLANDMTPDSSKKDVFEHIVNKTMNDFDGHISTGLVGEQWLWRTLTDFNRPDMAYDMLTKESYPGFGYMIDHDATTIWELWNGNTADPAMNSRNHVMLLGDLIIWFYEDLAGIKSADGSKTGFKKIKMKPHPVEDLDSIDASYHSVRGEIKSKWKQNEDEFDWEVRIPANTTAKVYIPADDMDDISENGANIDKVEQIEFVEEKDGRFVFEVGSGDYKFVSNF